VWQIASVIAILLVAVSTFHWLLNTHLILQIIVGLTSAVVGAWLPVYWATQRRRQVQNWIWTDLPDAIDIMSISVESGLGFDQAMSKYSLRFDSELSDAFERVVKGIQLGRTRREALKEIADRYDEPNLRAFTGSIIQADQLGVSISKVLKIQSERQRYNKSEYLKHQILSDQHLTNVVARMIMGMAFVFWTLFVLSGR
jgi:tight adherence protein C